MPERDTYEYIIVGGGTAGCVLATRLSEDPGSRVLLLEAGPAEPLSAPPRRWPSLLGSAADWADTTVPQGSAGDRVPWPRGRGLGGSSAINAMAFLRGHRSSYDAWAAGGAKGWGYDDLLPYFKRSENVSGVRRRDLAVRGTAGPLRVAPAGHHDRHPVAQAFLAAAVQAGHPRTGDLAAGLTMGFGWGDLSIVDGARESAADAYLRPVLGDRTNLRVEADAPVRRLLLDGAGTDTAGTDGRTADGPDGDDHDPHGRAPSGPGTSGPGRVPRCTGVEYAAPAGQDTGAGPRTAHCSPGGEVVLAAGAVGSPQLLMLSGLGPRDHLDQTGVAPRVDLPGVGANLQDHVASGLVYRSATAVPHSRNNHAEVLGLLRGDPRDPACSGPDLQLRLVDVPLRAKGLDGPAPGDGYTIMVGLMAPYSRGTVRLADADPAAPPLIDPRYYADQHDVDLMVTGLRAARTIGEEPALSLWHGTEELPGPGTEDDDALCAYLFRDLHSLGHYAGTCAIGTDTDEGAVVDTELRVRGVDGLRVADASVMPTVVSADTEATVYAVAERAADLLRG
ncbi:GMC family oxidoreductase N-terminal domain-containing protein [Streptomyces sp. DW26H14]|uniref:GMC family oxidoreductase N-terminal domain-containing protein n=1 Tax=Streptomyces sp. DW26H14 TaxID=3435395 RepID=UPI00403DF403